MIIIILLLFIYFIYLLLLLFFYFHFIIIIIIIIIILQLIVAFKSGNCTYPVFAKSNTWTWGSSFNSGLNATSLILWNIDKHSWLHLDFSVSL